ncbi:PadR family transcriptional regulator [Kutzneria buriramensis]|nr:PadR family transcriptional regulator [Kutzneria buriramensis]
MSLRHALIGLLRESPASGYDLMHVFNSSLAKVWPATKSQVYTELAKLADAGLLVVTAEGPRGRKEYAPTEAGLAELRRWMLDAGNEAPTRSESLLRVFMLGALTRDQARDYLHLIQRRSAEDLAAMTAFGEHVDWDREDMGDLRIYGRMVLEFATRLAELSRDWSEWAAQQIPPTDS